MSDLYRYFIRLSYKGTNYHGWQSQKNAISVQSVINRVLSVKLNEQINVTGAGRTDTGVHARFFMAHFDSRNQELEKNTKIIYGLNKMLPPDIAIHNIIRVHSDAHSRYDAISRTYEYHIITQKSPFDIDTSYFYTGKLDILAMNKACEILKKYTDFKSFCKSNSGNKTTLCEIYEAKWNTLDNKLIFTIKANRFLRNMVRAITGTLLDVGLQKTSISKFRSIVESKDRKKAGRSVPAQGLFLTHIEYPYLRKT